MKRLILLLLIFFLAVSVQIHSSSDRILVTVHGFLGSPWNLDLLTSVYDEDTQVIPWGYPSRAKLIQEHGKDLVVKLKSLAEQNPGKPIDFLTHSMGGLVLRAAINQPDCPIEAKIGKAVLLGPPNQGSAWGRFLGQIALVEAIAKAEAGRQLLTEENFEFLGQFPESCRVLVIAGHLSLNPFLKGPNDGLVFVEETRLNTPHKLITIDAGHVTMLLSQQVASLAKQFFEEK